MAERSGRSAGTAIAPADDSARHTTHLHTPSVSWQAIKFAVVGASGTALTFVLLTALHKGFGWPIWIANVPAYGAGIVNNYLWNRYWTFGHVARRNVLHQGSQFVAISVAGLVLNTIILQVVESATRDYYLAFLVAAGIVYCWNFVLNHQVTFRHTAEALRHPHLPGHHAEPSTVTLPGDGD
ncbi:MAG TPA: GtrA family protein [Dehalococcoidia bacterium]|nr:GtrA family protein [Dehalococcoidia bacterium]